MSRKPLLVTIVLLIASACGGGPTSPSQASPPLADGNFILAFGGGSLECQDVKSPQAGTSVTVRVRAGHSGGTWIGRAASEEDGDFEIRLMRTSEAVSMDGRPIGPLDVPVAGTLVGIATDSYRYTPTFVLSGTSAVFAATTPISGVIQSPAGTLGNGVVSGPMTFSRAGVSATCPSRAVGWLLNGPVPI